MLLVAPGGENQTFRPLHQHALGKAGTHLQPGHNCEGVGRVLLAPEHRQVHFVDQAMTHFVAHHEYRISNDEFHELLFRVRRHLFQTRHSVESLDRLADAGDDLGLLRRQLCGCRRHIDYEGCEGNRACHVPAIHSVCHRDPLRSGAAPTVAPNRLLYRMIVRRAITAALQTIRADKAVIDWA